MRQVNTDAVLYRKIDKTVYEINVMQSDNAKESAEDILVRLIANESIRNVKEEDDDWTDPEVWKKANPSLVVTVGIDKVESACERQSRIREKRMLLDSFV